MEVYLVSNMNKIHFRRKNSRDLHKHHWSVNPTRKFQYKTAFLLSMFTTC